MDAALTTGQGYFVPPATMDSYLSKKYNTKTSQAKTAEESDDIVRGPGCSCTVADLSFRPSRVAGSRLRVLNERGSSSTWTAAASSHSRATICIFGPAGRSIYKRLRRRWQMSTHVYTLTCYVGGVTVITRSTGRSKALSSYMSVACHTMSCAATFVTSWNAWDNRIRTQFPW